MPNLASGTAGTGSKAGLLMTTFLDNWEESNCWDGQAPESRGGGEAITSGVSPFPRPAVSDERLESKPEPLVLGAGALLALLGIFVRYIKSLERSEEHRVGKEPRSRGW